MEIFRWLRWQWRQFEIWQKCYIFGAFFVGAGIVAPAPYHKYLLTIPLVMLLAWTLKWWIWDQAKESWNKYKKQRDTLFDTIRGDKE